MKRLLFGALFASAVLFGGASGRTIAAASPVLGDFDIPSQHPSRAQALRRVGDPGRVRIEMHSELGGPVVYASGAQDAINAAIDHLDRRPGAVFISTDAGLGVVGIGSASNAAADAGNPVVAAEGLRLAAMEASLDARRRIADLLGRLGSAGRSKIAQQASALDGSETDAGTAMRRMLRGAVIYDLLETSDPQERRIVVVTTPRSEGRVQQVAHGVIASWSIEAGLTAVFSQIGADAAPASGAWVIGVVESGDVAWVAYGAAPIRPHADSGVQRQLRDEAFRAAEQRARRAMVQVVRGETVDAPEGFAPRLRRIEREFGSLLDPDESAGRAIGQIASRVASAGVSEDHIRSITRGAMPPGVQLRTYTSADGAWAQAVCVLTLRSEDAARRLSASLGQAPLGAAPRLGVPLRTGEDGLLLLNDRGQPMPAR